MAQPARSVYTVGVGQTIYGGMHANGTLHGGQTLDDTVSSGVLSTVPSSASGNVTLDDLAPGGGGFAGKQWPDAVLNLISSAVASGEKWVRLNPSGTSYQSAWVPDDYLPLYLGSPQSESKIILAWSGFAWDNATNSLILWGGGHANTNSNSVYRWKASSQNWENAYYPSDMVTSPITYPIDGYLNAPVSSHTYASNAYLPTLNRFITFGGASQPGGNPFAKYDTTSGTFQRYLGAYTLDMSQAGLGRVGGTTGSNPKRNTSAGVNLTGANAWAVRDWGLDHSVAGTTFLGMTDHINGWSHVRQENGHDTVYLTASNAGGTAHRAYRIEMVDGDYHNDIITQVGAPASGRSPQGCVHEARNIMVGLQDATNPIQYWNLNSAGSSNPAGVVGVGGISGTGVSALTASFSLLNNTNGGPAGMAYDESRQAIMIYLLSGEVLKLTPPASGGLSSGWVCDIHSAASGGTVPPTNSSLGASGSTSINGKWRRAQSLDVCLLLCHNTQGQIWASIPSGWVDPRL